MISANKPEALFALQTAFAAHIRNPESAPAPTDVEDRRIKVYRDLFFSNISKFLSGNFPVLRRLYDQPGWSRLVREFYAEHRAHTPLFTEIPKEFLRYIQEQRQDRPGDPPFLLELAHYEWVELALSLDQSDLDDISHDRDGDLLHGIPLLSPLAWPLSYRFPVHRIGPGYQPREPLAEATHLLVYRNRVDQVKFMQLNDVTRFLLAAMQEQPDLSGLRLLELTAARMGHHDHDRGPVIEHGLKLMQDLLSRDVLLGTRS